MRRQWLDFDVQALGIMKDSCLTKNCDTNVLAILDTHDNTCDHDASDEHAAPEQEWNSVLRRYRIYDLFYIVLFVGISM
jgi:Ran GTPase-activating protein (RanGAP) involved in mRNA processing and transport